MHQAMNNFQVVKQPDRYFCKLQWDNKLAIAIPREQYRSRSETENLGFNYQNIAYCFDHPDVIYDYSLVMLVRNDFLLLNELNHFIRRAIDGGLVDKWLKRYRSFGIGKLDANDTTVKLETLFIELVIYLGIATLAFIIVLVERFVYGKVKTPNSKPWWRYIEMAIDPYRYFLLDDLDWAT